MKKVEKWSWGYAVVKPWFNIIYQLTHRKIQVINRSVIPKDKPVIFAPNHQNALMDALAIVFSVPVQTVFLARADIFKKKLAAAALYFLKIIPVYRIRDGKDTLNKNEATFKKSIEVLSANKYLCLFPEGAHIGKRSMLAHKKAIPRIVFMAAAQTNYELDIQVVPVGLTYSHYYKFRRSLVVNFGEPIPAKQYYDVLEEQGEQKATIVFRNHIYKDLSSLIVNIPDKEASDFYESAFIMVRKSVLKKLNLKNTDVNSVKADQYFTNRLYKWLKENPDDKEWFINQQHEYNQLCEKLKIDEWTVQGKKYGFLRSGFTILLSIITLPITLAGAVVNGWLFYLTRYSYRKNIKDPQFWSSVSYGISLFAYTIWYLILWGIASIFIENILIALLVALLPIPAGILAYELGKKLLRMRSSWRLSKLKRKNSDDWKKLAGIRKDLLDFYNKVD